MTEQQENDAIDTALDELVSFLSEGEGDLVLAVEKLSTVRRREVPEGVRLATAESVGADGLTYVGRREGH